MPAGAFKDSSNNTLNANFATNSAWAFTTYNFTPPNLSLNDAAISQRNAGATSFTLTVGLSAAAPNGGVTIYIATVDGTEVAPGDCTTKSLTTQTIPAGSNTYSFTVLLNGDTTAEAIETFFANVTNVVGAIVTDAQGQGTINNDDTSASIDALPDTSLFEDQVLAFSHAFRRTGVTTGTTVANFTVGGPDRLFSASRGWSQLSFLWHVQQVNSWRVRFNSR